MSVAAAFVQLEGRVPGERLVEGVLDFGRLVEALVFYDRMYLAAPRAQAFVALCRRLLSDGDFNAFLALLREHELIIVDYDFYTSIQIAGPESTAAKAMHIRDSITSAGKVFEHHSLGAPALQALLSGSQRVKLRRAALEELFLIKQGDKGRSLIDDANADYGDPAVVSFILSRLAAVEGPAIILPLSPDLHASGDPNVELGQVDRRKTRAPCR
jgi:hypothetical protein